LDDRRRIITDGAVAIQDDSIIAVGKTHELKRDQRARITIDGRGQTVLPGLIDCHAREAQAIMRGAAEDTTFPDPWLTQYVWPLEGHLTPEIARASARLCMLEMIKSGTTTFADPLIHLKWDFDSIAQSVWDSGLRAVLCKSVNDTPTYAALERKDMMIGTGMEEDKDAAIAEAMRMHHKWHGKDNRIKIWFGPTTPGGCTQSTLKEVTQLARENGMGVTTNFAEEEEDVEYVKKAIGTGMFDYARACGLVGENILLVHSIGLSNEEIDYLAATKTRVCTTPISEGRFGPVTRAVEMLEKGVCVSLGCDGGIASNTYDMFREMRGMAALNKVDRLPTAMPCETCLEIATRNGAKALGWEGIVGSIEVGKKADLIVANLDSAHVTPNINVLASLVHSVHGGDVTYVIANGKMIMSEGEVKTMDEERVLKDARKCAEELISAAGLSGKVGPKWPVA
jgi:cytosine/adenosine deaminase-related metal-dependent hydrolase